jgi:hypothetical protein
MQEQQITPKHNCLEDKMIFSRTGLRYESTVVTTLIYCNENHLVFRCLRYL